MVFDSDMADREGRGFMMRKKIVRDQIQHKPAPIEPYVFDREVDSGIEDAFDTYYGTADWRNRYPNYIARAFSMPDDRNVWKSGPDVRTDYFGSVWRSTAGTSFRAPKRFSGERRLPILRPHSRSSSLEIHRRYTVGGMPEAEYRARRTLSC